MVSTLKPPHTPVKNLTLLQSTVCVNFIIVLLYLCAHLTFCFEDILNKMTLFADIPTPCYVYHVIQCSDDPGGGDGVDIEINASRFPGAVMIICPSLY